MTAFKEALAPVGASSFLFLPTPSMTHPTSSQPATKLSFRVAACQTEYKKAWIEAADAQSARLIAEESLGGLRDDVDWSTFDDDLYVDVEEA